jgi:hypothetical protein
MTGTCAIECRYRVRPYPCLPETSFSREIGSPAQKFP